VWLYVARRCAFSVRGFAFPRLDTELVAWGERGTLRTMQFSRVLVTGASGALGHTVACGLRERGYAVRGFDRVPGRHGSEHLVGDLLDVEAVKAAAREMDAVIHLAAVADRQRFAAEIVPHNIVGTHHMLEAARLARVRRFVYASSCRVVGGLNWEGERIGLDVGFVPSDHYGVSKATGELLSDMYARRFGMQIVCARLGWFPRNVEEAEKLPNVSFGKRIFLSHADALRFFVRALETAELSQATVFVVSKNDGDPAFDLEPARRLLGYEPEDSFPDGCHFSEEIRFASPEFAPSLLPDGELTETRSPASP
jgi:uronate dehydrogenase